MTTTGKFCNYSSNFIFRRRPVLVARHIEFVNVSLLLLNWFLGMVNKSCNHASECSVRNLKRCMRSLVKKGLHSRSGPSEWNIGPGRKGEVKCCPLSTFFLKKKKKERKKKRSVDARSSSSSSAAHDILTSICTLGRIQSETIAATCPYLHD